MQTKTLYRFASLFALISLVISSNLVAHAATPAAPAQAATDFTFAPVADAYVIQSTPDSNFGASTSLRVDSTPPTSSYLRFVVNGLNGAIIQSAKLRIYANSANTIGYSVYIVSDNNWTESTITFNNSPAMGNNIANSLPFGSAIWTEVDLSSYIQAEGTYNLAITTTSATNTNLASRESAGLAPQLVLSTNSQATSIPTSTTAPTLAPTNAPTSTSTPVSTATQTPAPTATSTPGQSQNLTFTPSADAYVNAGSANTNYGGSNTLRVDASPIVKNYLRFTVGGLGGQAISQARLLIYATSSSSQGLVAQSVADNTWDEMIVNSTNAPTLGGTLASSAAVSTGSWVTLDVTSYVNKEGTFSFGVTTPGSTAIGLSSRESGANSPKLIVTINGSSTPLPTSTPTLVLTSTPTSTPPVSGTNNILLLAGDICKHNPGSTDYTANCKKTGDLVRSILAANPGAQVQTLGDNVNNDSGTPSYDAEYTDLYAPNWGSFLSATHALVGNHDLYPPSGTTPYFNYFGVQAGPVKPSGYYSYNIGSNWHVIVLNAQCGPAGGCAVDTLQYNWLKTDLTANTKKCVLAVWHQPRWTSGRWPDDATYAVWWDLLYQYKVDIVAGGHNHNYERFNLINPQEQAAADGIREFVVGTGGAPGDGYTYASHPLNPNEAIRNQSIIYGVLKLTLSDNSYTWDYLPAAGFTFTDSGTTACH